MGKGLDLGAEPPRIKICRVPPGIRSERQGQGLTTLITAAKETMSERVFTGFGILTKYIVGFG